MPLFEFICLDCNEQSETLVLDADEEINRFSCESKNLEKRFSPFETKSEGEAQRPLILNLRAVGAPQ